jgi:hypothetical protein
MRYPTHLIDFQTALSPVENLTNKLLDLSGSTLSASNLSFSFITSTEISLPGGSIVLKSVINVNENSSTEMKKTNETFTYTSAVIKNVNPLTDISGSGILRLYNKPIEFTNPSIALPLPSAISTVGGKISGTIYTMASITYKSAQITAMAASPTPGQWRCTVTSTTGFISGNQVQILGVGSSDSAPISFFNTGGGIIAIVTLISAPNTIDVLYSGTNAIASPGPPIPVISGPSLMIQETLAFTNAFVQLQDQRITVTGGQAIPDLSGASGPAMVSGSDDSVYFSFISRYRNNINYSNTMYDILVGRIKPSWTLDWLHRINGLVTSKDEATPVITIGAEQELYLAYMTTGSTLNSLNGIEINEDTNTYAVCGCPDPSSCTLCGVEDVVLARLDTVGASSSTPPTVTWKVQNGFINSIYRETRPSVAVDTATGLVYLAYECNRNIACFSPIGSPNILLHCFTTQGNHLWIQAESSINCAGANTAPSISADNTGNVYLAYEITAQVSGGTPVPAGQKQIEVVRFQTILTTPSPANTYNSSTTYGYGTWVYYPPTSSWYQVKTLSLINEPPPSPNWSEAYSANVLYSGRVWVLSQPFGGINIFTEGGIAGDDSSQPSIIAHPSNGYVFLTFLTTGNVMDYLYDNSSSTHDVVMISFTKDRQVRWIQQGGDIFNPEEITYTDCTLPRLIMDGYGNLLLSLVTSVTSPVAGMNLAVFHFDQDGDSRWGYPRTEEEKYPVYMFARTDAPNAVFNTEPTSSFSGAVGVAKSFTNIFTGTVTKVVAPGQTQVGTAGTTYMLCISVFNQSIYYRDRDAFSYMVNIRSICTCGGKENCGCF